MALPYELTIALGAAVAALVFAFILARYLLKLPAGNETMQEIGLAIRQGAMAYLNRQFRTIAVVAAVLLVIIYFAVNSYTALAFLVGAAFSGLAAYAGMSVSVR